MRIVHAIPSFRVFDGGPPRSVGQACDALAKLPELDVHIVTCSGPDVRAPISQQVRYHEVPGGQRNVFQRLTFQGFRRALESVELEGSIDIIHNHGVWLRSCQEVSAFASDHHKPMCLSPRGMFDPWSMSHHRLKKRLAWLIYQRRNLRAVTAFHATSSDEATSIRSIGMKQPICVIPNGVELEPFLTPSRTSRQASKARRSVLFLSRIHPKKGIDLLIDVWDSLGDRGWDLVIAGNDDGGHEVRLKAIVRERGLAGTISFIGPLYGEAKYRAYADADLFVLPTFSENFGIVVAEALASGLPVITTKGAPWKELQTYDCGWWVEPTVSGIKAAFEEAFSAAREDLMKMGIRGTHLVESKYQWPGIAARFVEFYEWLLNGGRQPSFVV